MDDLTKEQRHRNMQHICGKDTKPELMLRKALWHAGIRYRKNVKTLPGKPDIVITRYKIIVFVDGDFWHGKDFNSKKPVATNHAYWDAKIKKNIERDQEVNRQLHGDGWLVLRFWESEIKKDIDSCVKAVLEAINEQRYFDYDGA